MRISYSLTAIGQKVADILIASGLNVAQWSGSNVAAPNVAGYPVVDTHYHRGSAENVLIAGRRDVNVGAITATVTVTAITGMSTQHITGTGTWTNAGDTIDATIPSAVVVAKSWVVPRWQDFPSGIDFSWEITSTTNVRFTLRENLGGATGATLYFTVVTFP